MFYLLVVIVRGHVTVKSRLLLAVLQFAVCSFLSDLSLHENRLSANIVKVNFDAIFTAV